MMHELPFLQAILQTPEDDAPRLVYADWLEERGDPRGDFIRVQCALAKMSADDPRRPRLLIQEQRLLAEHERGWVEPLRKLSVSHWVFRRGLAAEVSLEALAFLEHADDLFRLAPVRRLCLTDLGDLLPDVLRHPCLAHISSLDLSANLIQDAGARTLAAAPQLSGLTRLDLGDNLIFTEGIEALAASPHLAGLTDLRLGRDDWRTGIENGVDAAAVTALAASPYLGRLTTLHLGGCGIPFGDAGVTALAASPFLGHLTALNLGCCWLRDAGAEALATSAHSGRLTALNLAANWISDRGAAALATSPGLARLTALDLSENCYIRNRAALTALSRATLHWGLAADPDPMVGDLRTELLSRRGVGRRSAEDNAATSANDARGRIPLVILPPEDRDVLILETRRFGPTSERAGGPMNLLEAWMRADDFLASLGYPVRLRAYSVDDETAQRSLGCGNPVDARDLGREIARRTLGRLLSTRLFRADDWTVREDAQHLADRFLGLFDANSYYFGQSTLQPLQISEEVVVVVGGGRVGLLWVGDAG